MRKQILFSSHGKDQLDRDVGKALPGDTAKCHLKASFTAELPSFTIGKKTFGVKVREKEFLSTRVVGSTAFFEVEIPTVIAESPTTFEEILAECLRTMSLGEAALFRFDFASLDPKVCKEMQHKLHKGHYSTVPENAQELLLEIESFRIARDTTEHFRVSRYGSNGGRMPGSFSMGM